MTMAKTRRRSTETVTTWNRQVFDVIRPEDLPRGERLRYAASEHDEMTMPQAIQVTDREGRWAVYVPVEGDGGIPPEDRPQDRSMDGSGLRFTRLEHDEAGGLIKLQVRDRDGRTAQYVPLEIDGKMVRPRLMKSTAHH
jgi:hypothetical protein